MAHIQKQFRKGGKAWQRFWQRVRSGSPLDIAIVVVAGLLVLLVVAILVLHLTQDPIGTAVSDNSTSQGDSISAEDLDADYDKEAASIDETLYDGTMLPLTADAGSSYIDGTLFIGDSNTERMMLYGVTTLQNNLGIVGMGIQNVLNTACIYFQGYSSPVYVPKAVELLQPQRIIITFGTNNTSWDTDTFIAQYRKALVAIHDAYPTADIIINAVPPVAQQRSYPNISMKTIDSFNLALVELAQAEGCYFLNSSEALKNPDTGYAKEGYMVSDGIHLSEAGMDALVTYIRTHAYESENTQPTPTNVPTHLATPDGLFGGTTTTSSSSSSASSKAQTVTVQFSIQGDKTGGKLEGTLTQEVVPGEACTPVTLVAETGYTAVWGCTEGSITNHDTATKITFTVPSYTKLETINVWVTLTKTVCEVHTYAEPTIKQPTCGAAGEKKLICTVCGTTTLEVLPATGQHTYEVVQQTASTCTVAGTKELRCTVCGAVTAETLPLVAHTEQLTSETPAQVGVDGVRVYTCTVCGNVRTEVIPALAAQEPAPDTDTSEPTQ